jgi:hypothetical protein
MSNLLVPAVERTPILPPMLRTETVLLRALII